MSGVKRCIACAYENRIMRRVIRENERLARAGKPADLAALDSDDATISDVRAVLYLLGRGLTPVDPTRLMGICMRLSGALGQFSDCLDVPPAALNDVVRDVLFGCRNDLCAEKVAPWHDDFDGCCSPDCQTTWLRTVE